MYDNIAFNISRYIIGVIILLVVRRLIQYNLTIYTLDRSKILIKNGEKSNKSGYTSDNSDYSEQSL